MKAEWTEDPGKGFTLTAEVAEVDIARLHLSPEERYWITRPGAKASDMLHKMTLIFRASEREAELRLHRKDQTT